MTASSKELLAELNKARENRGLKPLKAWKESRAKLEAAVAAIPPLTTETEPVGDADSTAGDASSSPPTSPAGPTPEAKVVKRQPKRDDATRLTVIARFNSKKEKVLRAKARRWQSKLRQYTVDPSVEDWTFFNEHLVEVCKILGVKVPTAEASEETDPK